MAAVCRAAGTCSVAADEQPCTCGLVCFQMLRAVSPRCPLPSCTGALPQCGQACVLCNAVLRGAVLHPAMQVPFHEVDAHNIVPVWVASGGRSLRR